MQKLSKKSVWQFLKYNFGGFVYFWTAWAIITFLTDSLGSVQAYLLGNFVGLSLNYLVQRFWVFSEGQQTLLNSGWKFIVLTIVNLVLGYYLLQLLVGLSVPLWLAQFGNAGFFMVWNWVWYKYWVFREVK
jgi:putative flippase GtrA